MKFLAIALLAVCLIQGHSAQPQFSGLRNLVSNAASSVSSAANNAVSAATNAAKTAASTAQSAVSNAESLAENALSTAQNAASTAVSSAQSALSGLSDNAQSVISSATSGSINLSNIKASLNKLTPEELLETISGTEEFVKSAVEKVQSSIETAVGSVADAAKAKISDTTTSWNSDVAKAVANAAVKGIDISQCSVNSVTDLGAEVAEDTAACVTKKVSEGAKLLKKIVALPERATTVTINGVAAYRKCSALSGLSKGLCVTTDVVPAAYKAAVLLKDTVSYTTQSVKFVSTIKEDVAICAAKVTATNAAKALKLSTSVVGCVKSTIAAAA